MKYRFSRQLTHRCRNRLFPALFCLGTAGTIFRYQDFNPSVVIAPDVKMLISPFTSSASIGTLPEGRLVYPQKSHGNFSYVTDEMDRQGWINLRALKRYVNRLSEDKLAATKTLKSL